MLPCLLNYEREEKPPFNAAIETYHIIEQIKKIFKESGSERAILGMSGGKDSTICAKLLSEALGPDNVSGIIMPDTNVGMDKENIALEICKFLGIRYHTVPITYPFFNLDQTLLLLSEEAKRNTIARVRMTTLYALAQSSRARVCGTSNASEYYLGYFTKWGDGVADLQPIIDYTCSEVIEIGKALGLPEKYIHIPPSDDLCGEADEDRFGFSYGDIDSYLINGTTSSKETSNKIVKMHSSTNHKRTCIPKVKRIAASRLI